MVPGETPGRGVLPIETPGGAFYQMNQITPHLPIIAFLAILIGILIMHWRVDRKPKTAMRKQISVCAWCPDKKGREFLARLENPEAQITHGICPACRRRVMAEMNEGGETTP